MKPLKEKNLKRLLLGPGPTNCSKNVLEASSLPLLGHLDPTFGEIMVYKIITKIKKYYHLFSIYTLKYILLLFLG